MKELFEQFIRDKVYLEDIKQTTVESYRTAYKAYQRVLSRLPESSTLTGERDLGNAIPTKDTLKDFVIGLRKTGISPGGCNLYIRSMNSFLSWLHTNGHIREPLKLNQLKTEKRILKPLTDQQLKVIFAFRPTCFTERRLIALLSVLLDTGLRINEALTLKRSKLDFDNLYLSVIGKGNKERVIPFSIELRKVLFKFLGSHDFELVFCTRHGRKMNYHNVRRDLEALLDKLGIKTDGAFHAFRRTFAKTYVKAGGNLFYLQTILGHSDVSTTRKYVDVQIEDLQAIHQSASALSRLRR